jgi:hypothetical protein
MAPGSRAARAIRAVVFSTDDRTSYRALIDTFAQGVVDRLK